MYSFYRGITFTVMYSNTALAFRIFYSSKISRGTPLICSQLDSQGSKQTSRREWPRLPSPLSWSDLFPATFSSMYGDVITGGAPTDYFHYK